ncbi:MAG: sugar-transfer associated ATP-grasp domain-containing protein [Hyphomicrobiaceae bacterium]|nr:sugar-transfer associated ATP-grasp domain-containing protein [Hyphomicrobiaceae bacterium]
MAEPARRLEAPEAVAAAPVSGPGSAAAPAQPALDLESRIGKSKLDIAGSFQLIASQHGRSYNQVLVEIAKLAFGPGKLKVDEYLDLGLYDDKALAGQDKRSFVGLDVMRQIWMTVNHKTEWYGLLEHKLAATTLLAGFGFPTIATRALYSEEYALPGIRTLATADALASFLRDAGQYPLFGKPADSLQSIGSVSLAGYDADRDSVVTLNGDSLPVTTLTEEISSAYKGGYIFQGRLDPHPAIEAICGQRLATCRIVTVRTETGVEVLRALWKIPAGRNVADNFWRSGNMLGQLDMASGRVVRVQRGAGVLAQEPETHPDTGAQMIGFTIPDFAGLKATACAAHSVFKDVNLIGWDMASTAAGPVIVEPNITPDFFLPQVVDRRGILDEPMKALIQRCKAAKAATSKVDAKQYRAEQRARRNRVTSAALKG